MLRAGRADPWHTGGACRAEQKLEGDSAVLRRIEGTSCSSCLILSFRVEGAEAVPFAAAPMLALKLRVENADPPRKRFTPSRLRAQIQIEAHAAPATTLGDKERLLDLFGEPDRWSRTLRPMLWTHAEHGDPRRFKGSHGRICRCPARSISTSRPPNIFTGVGGRHSAESAVQRHRFLCDGDGRAAGGADLLGQRGAVPAAR